MIKRGLWFAWTCFGLSACVPAMQPGMVYEKAGLKAYGRYPHQGHPQDGYFSFLSIDLPLTQDIKLIFPDGYTEPINTIVESTLKQHAHFFGHFEASRWGPISIYWLDRSSGFLSFIVADGKLVSLSTEDDCKTHTNIFIATNGKHLGLPLSYKDFYETFGPPVELNTSWTNYILGRAPCQ